MILWSLWKKRNDKVWADKEVSHGQDVRHAWDYLHAWKWAKKNYAVHGHGSEAGGTVAAWEPPPTPQWVP